MYLSESTLDDLLHGVYAKLLKSKNRVRTTKGVSTEQIGVTLELRQPRARLSRSETKGTIFSCLGETLWYLSRTNDLSFIRYYLPDYYEFSDDGKTIYGGYGPRLFGTGGGTNQIASITKLLTKKSTTRQAVIQIFDAADILEDHKDVPCTCILQFLLRDGRLNLVAYMRSNDAFKGLPHDVFAFTFIQELVARSLGVELGLYKHLVGSMHLYESDEAKARAFLKEGWQATTRPMRPMPSGDQWTNVERVLQLEPLARATQELDLSSLPNFWADIVRLRQVFAQTSKRAINKLKSEMSSDIFNAYIDKRALRPRRMGAIE